MNQYTWPTFPIAVGFKQPQTEAEARFFVHSQNRAEREKQEQKDREQASKMRAIEEQGRQARRHVPRTDTAGNWPRAFRSASGFLLKKEKKS